MCVPAAVPWVIGGLMGASAYSTSEANNKAADHNASIANRNAAVADAEALDAKKRGNKAGNDSRQSFKALKSTQRVNLAGSGVLLDTGSAADIIRDTNVDSDQDAMTIKYNTSKDVWAKEQSALNYREQSKMYKKSKTNSLLAGAAGVASAFV